jgi:hypothetical protein
LDAIAQAVVGASGADTGRLCVASLVLPNIRTAEGAPDKPRALAMIIEYTRKAAAQGAQLIITPETCLDGYAAHRLDHAAALAFAEDAECGLSAGIC